MAGFRTYRQIPFPELPTCLRFPTRLGSVRLDEAFVPAYRCGAVLDSHQIPCCHTRLGGYTNSTRQRITTLALKKAHCSGLPLLPASALQFGYLRFLFGKSQTEV